MSASAPTVSVPTARDDARQRIIDVAAQLLRDGGRGAVTTRGVADAAGTQAPTIYRLFGDKDGLLDAVAEHVMATYVTAKSELAQAERAGDGDPLEDLRRAWQTQIEFGVANPALFTLLSDPVRGRTSPATKSGLEVLQARVHRLALAGRLRVREARAVELISAAGNGAVLTILSAPPELRDLDLADDLFEAVARQIVQDAPDIPSGEPLAQAIAFRAAVPELASLSIAERAVLAEWMDRVIEPGRSTP